MSPRNVLITGCNRGIGLELVKQFLALSDPPTNIFATCRDVAKAEELNAVAAQNAERVHVLQLETTDFEAHHRIADQIKAVLKDGEGLNLILNNAAVRPFEKDRETTPDKMMEAFKVNCVSPLFLTKAVLPLIKTAAEANKNMNFGVNRAAVIMMSTAVSSISENSGGGDYSYRSSKTALNMVMKNLSIDLKPAGILVMCMHPGWVQTEMGGQGALIDTATCASTMLQTFEKLCEDDHGTMKRYNNSTIPW